MRLISRLFTGIGVLVGASFAFTGTALANTPDNYAGVSLQTDDSIIGVFGKAQITEVDGFIDGVSARPALSFDDDISANLSVTADKDFGRNFTAFAGPVIGYDSTGDDDNDINLGVALGADYQIGDSNFVANGTAIVGSSDSSFRVGLGFGF